MITVNNKENIEDLFKDAFQNFEASVDAGAWNNIQSKINVGNTTATKGTKSFLNSTVISVAAVSIVAVSLVATAWFVNDRSSTKLAGTAIEKTLKVIEKDLPKESLNTELDKEIEIINSVEDAPVELVNPPTQEAKFHKEIEVKVEKIVANQNQEFDNSRSSEKPNIPKPSILANTATSQNVISNAPETIVVKDQSKVVASPMGGNAPLTVSFSSLTEVRNIKWKFDDGTESSELSPTHIYETPGIYFVTMLAELNDGTVTMDKAVVEVRLNETSVKEVVEASSIFVPNVFTPNGDGKNDQLVVKANNVDSFTFSIYSVGGKLVYKSENPESSWDGTDLGGNTLPDGVYYYLINTIGQDGNVYAPKGYISIRTQN
jgi:gliding motility-associated-like protein